MSCKLSLFHKTLSLDKEHNDSKFEDASLNNSRITNGAHNTSGIQRGPFVAQNS